MGDWCGSADENDDASRCRSAAQAKWVGLLIEAVMNSTSSRTQLGAPGHLTTAEQATIGLLDQLVSNRSFSYSESKKSSVHEKSTVYTPAFGHGISTSSSHGTEGNPESYWS